MLQIIMSELYKITNINPVLIVPEHVHIAHVVEIYIYMNITQHIGFSISDVWLVYECFVSL